MQSQLFQMLPTADCFLPTVHQPINSAIIAAGFQYALSV